MARFKGMKRAQAGLLKGLEMFSGNAAFAPSDGLGMRYFLSDGDIFLKPL